MEQSEINDAVKECVRYTMGSPEPLKALQNWLDRLAASGWPKAEVMIVRQTAVRMLSAIYNVEGIDELS